MTPADTDTGKLLSHKTIKDTNSELCILPVLNLIRDVLMQLGHSHELVRPIKHPRILLFSKRPCDRDAEGVKTSLVSSCEVTSYCESSVEEGVV